MAYGSDNHAVGDDMDDGSSTSSKSSDPPSSPLGHEAASDGKGRI